MTDHSDHPGLDLLWPAPAKRAAALPPLLAKGNGSFWEDICDVLLDPEPHPPDAETVRRWLREQVGQDLMERLSQHKSRHLTVWACRIAPRMIWRLPCSAADPPARFHRRITAILLPQKLKLLERQLARIAFHWHFRAAPPRGDG